MFINLFLHAWLKLKKNKKYIRMASFCMAVSTFVIMLIFMSSHAAKEMVLSYFYSRSPQLFSVVCKIEGDTKYLPDADEIEQIAEKYSQSIEDAYYCISSNQPCMVSGKDIVLSVSGVSCMPDNKEICSGKDIFSENVNFGNEIMLSEKTAEELYVRPESAVGKSITVSASEGAKEYRIAGVYRSINDSESNSALLTISSYSELFSLTEAPKFGYIQFRLSDIKNSENMAMSIKKIFSDRYSADPDYKVMIMNLDLTKDVTSVIRIVTFVLIIASIIIILVSGIGIRNVIISIMQSYTHIIGIEKAIGASEGVIAGEYLLQGVAIALSGTFIGCSSALVLMAILNMNISKVFDIISQKFSLGFLTDLSFRFNVTTPEILLTVLISGTMVMFCCYDPVRTIASMKVVDSIHQ